MTGSKASLIVAVPLPTTLIFANVFAEINGLNNQNTQVMNVGTLIKNFFDCEGVRVDPIHGGSRMRTRNSG